MTRIAATVPMRNYSCSEVEYIHALDNMSRMAMLWAMDFWRVRSLLFEAAFSFQVSSRRMNYEEADISLEKTKDRERDLLALDRALHTICEETGLDPESIRSFAGLRPHKSTSLVDGPDLKIQAEYERIMLNAIE